MSSCRPLALAALLSVACASAPPPRPAVPVNRWGRPLAKATPTPGWVDKLPENARGRLYSVGRSGPTFWPQDALNNAAEDARGKLALGLASHVESLGQSVQTEARQHAVEIDKEASDVVMQNSRIEATWVDESGARDEPGSAWALAVIDLDSVRGKGTEPLASPAAWTPGSKTTPPSWLDRLPRAPARIFATGYSGPTFRPEDAVQNAADTALDNLALSLRSHVQAYELLVQGATGLSVEEFSRADDPDQALKDLVKKSAKIEATWTDADGLRPGDPPNSAWALASIAVQSTRGNYDAVENQDLGPALDRKGNAPPEPAAAPAPSGSAPPAPAK